MDQRVVSQKYSVQKRKKHSNTCQPVVDAINNVSNEIKDKPGGNNSLLTTSVAPFDPLVDVGRNNSLLTTSVAPFNPLAEIEKDEQVPSVFLPGGFQIIKKLIRPTSSESVLHKVSTDANANTNAAANTNVNTSEEIIKKLPLIKLKTLNNKIYRLSCLDQCCYTLTNTTYIYSFYNDLDSKKMIYLTGASGGGAGGIGNIKGMYFISGGGGGAGCAISNYPLYLEPSCILTVKIGKGGNAKLMEHGNRTYIQITDIEGVIYKSTILEGGKNGLPSYQMVKSQNTNASTSKNCHVIINDRICLGGLGGKIQLTCANNGNSGDPGILGLPSQNVSTGGCGGNSFFDQGGNGGGNLVAPGGFGGNKGPCKFNILGSNGFWGSGGGGSCPLSNFDRPQLSGNGGDGFVKLDFCCKII